MTRSTKTNGSLLNLAAYTPGSNVPALATAVDEGRSLSKRQGKAVEEANNQVLAMRIHAAKGYLGVVLTDELDRCAFSRFAQTSAYVTATTAEAQGKPQEGYVQEFGHALLNRGAQVKLAILDSATGTILREIERPVYVEAEKQVSLLRRLLGG